MKQEKILEFNKKYTLHSNGDVYGPMGKLSVCYGFGTRYPLVRIKNPESGKITFFAVHRLVAENFIGPKPFQNAVVRHKNDIKTDNDVSNLEWGTRSQNMADAKRNGTRLFDGEGNPNSILTTENVIDIRRKLKDGYTLQRLASEFGVSLSPIFKIKHRKTWKNI